MQQEIQRLYFSETSITFKKKADEKDSAMPKQWLI